MTKGGRFACLNPLLDKKGLGRFWRYSNTPVYRTGRFPCTGEAFFMSALQMETMTGCSLNLSETIRL